MEGGVAPKGWMVCGVFNAFLIGLDIVNVPLYCRYNLGYVCGYE